jgi:acyl-CoA synthetase (AMP-forming)/AMP-acid ligase II
MSSAVDPSRAHTYRSAGLWDGTTLSGQVQHWAQTRPGAVAVVDQAGARRHTYAELAADAGRVAALLTDVGVGPAEVVSVQLPNWYETVAVGLGVLWAGAVVNPLVPGYRERDLRYILGKAGSRVLFTPTTYRGFDYTPMVEATQAGLPSPVRHVTVDPRDGEPAAVALSLGTYGAIPPVAVAASDVSEVIFTSGTEATPKGVMHTEETTNFSVRAAYHDLDVGPQDVVWMPSPVGHSTGFNYGLRFALYHGLPLVLQDVWDATTAAALIEQERCSYTLAATTFLADLVARAGAEDLGSMQRFGCGGAPVPPALVRAALARGVGVLRLYGSTEVLVATWNRPDSAAESKENTDGRALEHVDVTIAGSADSPADATTGEILVRGPNTAVGFLDDPERTASTFTVDGWVRSGDLGIIDGAGYLSVVGRIKEIIIRGGMNIAPREIEEVLVSHPDVVAAAVIGLPDERLGEKACACLVLRPTAVLSADDVVRWLRAEGLSQHKLPERVEFVDALPYTASGKVKKHELVSALRG